MPADAVPAQSRTRGLAVTGLVLLLLLGAFYVYGAASDLVSLVGHNLPAARFHCSCLEAEAGTIELSG